MKRSSRFSALAARLGLLLATASAGSAADPTHVVVDDAWSGETGARFSGRLTETRPRADPARGAVKSLYRTSRLLLTSGEEGSVTWRVADHEWTTRTDDDGYWTLRTNRPVPLAPGWHEIETSPPASSPAGLLAIDPAARLGIISDLDDTILVSGVLKKPLLLRNSLAVPPEKRVPVPGMAELYHRLLRRETAPVVAPVFYVSASPRQLTDNLRGFLRHHGFPRGVLHLKEISEASEDSLFASDQQAYKTRVLETIFLACPRVRFALFGDDGEHDPEIYAALQKKFPDQIEGVWIRRVDPDPERARHPAQADLADLLAAPVVP